MKIRRRSGRSRSRGRRKKTMRRRRRGGEEEDEEEDKEEEERRRTKIPSSFSHLKVDDSSFICSCVVSLRRKWKLPTSRPMSLRWNRRRREKKKKKEEDKKEMSSRRRRR